MIGGRDPLASTGDARPQRQRTTSQHARATTGAATAWRRSVATRALQLGGRRFPGPRSAATYQLLARAFGRGIEIPLTSARTLRARRPLPGDIVCFDKGASTAPNRRSGEAQCAIGIVVRRNAARVTFIFLSGQRARFGVLSLRHANRHDVGGEVVNSYVRVIRPDDPPRTAYLAGELLAGFITIDPTVGRR